jgi:hypothetical protein
MNSIKIALCQMNVVDNKEKNIEKAIQMIKESEKQGADLAILPEMFNCPYENEKFIEYAEELDDSQTLKEISKIAKEEKIHVLAGSIPELERDDDGESIYNTAVFFDDTGKSLGKHRKMHLFDIDVKGGINLKKIFGDQALSIFVSPPSIDELSRRLHGRGDTSEDMIQKRLATASIEMADAPQFDCIVINDDLTIAKQDLESVIADWKAKH